MSMNLIDEFKAKSKPRTVCIGERMDSVLSLVRKLHGDSADAADKFLGCYPAAENKQDKAKAMPQGWLGELDDVIGQIERELTCVEDHIRRLKDA